MAGYGYTYRGAYTTYSGATSQTDGWRKTSYTSDHVYQPVISDAEGRRKPVISYIPDGNTEYYVTTEIIEPVPLVTGYKQSAPVRVEVLRDYSDGDSNWNRPSSPVKWRRPSSPVRYGVEEKWVRPSSPVHGRPQEVEDFITKIQTEASRPNNNRFGPLSATNWHKTPNSYHANTGYGDQSDLSNRNWQRPSGDTFRSESYDGAWARPSYGSSWSTPQKDELSKPTNDINTAMEYLTEAVKPSSDITKPSHGAWSTPQGVNHSKSTSDFNKDEEYEGKIERMKPESIPLQPIWNPIPVTPRGPKRNPYPETIDTREAARRHGNLKLASPRPGHNYTK